MDYLSKDFEELLFLLERTAGYAMQITNGSIDSEATVEFYHHSYAFIDKIQVLYTRLLLIGDENSRKEIEGLKEFCLPLGFRPGDDMHTFANELKDKLKQAIQDHENESFDEL